MAKPSEKVKKFAAHAPEFAIATPEVMALGGWEPAEVEGNFEPTQESQQASSSFGTPYTQRDPTRTSPTETPALPYVRPPVLFSDVVLESGNTRLAELWDRDLSRGWDLLVATLQARVNEVAKSGGDVDAALTDAAAALEDRARKQRQFVSRLLMILNNMTHPRFKQV